MDGVPPRRDFEPRPSAASSTAPAASPNFVPETAVSTLMLIYLPVVLGLYIASWRALRTDEIDRARHLGNLSRADAGRSAPRGRSAKPTPT